MARQSSQKNPGQRNKERRDLFLPYRLRVIEDMHKRRFFEHFDNRCFKCGKLENAKQEVGVPPNLCMDHHLPMALGGQLVPRNLVSLCRDCNERKLDNHPTEFYTREELTRLKPLLDTQDCIFDFSFNWDHWQEDRGAYLLAIGIDKELVNAALKDECFIGHVETGESQMEVTFSISDESLQRLLGDGPQ